MQTLSMIDSIQLKPANAKVIKLRFLYLLAEFKKIPELLDFDRKNLDCLIDTLEKNDIKVNYKLRYTWFQGKHILNKYLGHSQEINDLYLQNLNLDSNESHRICQLWIYQVIFQLAQITSNFDGLNCSFLLKKLKGNHSIDLTGKTRVEICLKEISDIQLKYTNGRIELIQTEKNKSYTFSPGLDVDSSFFNVIEKTVFEFENYIFSLPFAESSDIVGPFVETAVIRAESFADKFSEQLHEAFDLLKRLGFEDVFDYFNAILPFHTYKNYHNSSSPEELTGLIVVPSPNENFNNGKEILAECILHEALHNKLYQLEETTKFYADKSYLDEIYLSPWRREPRPIRMIMHGSFVFAPIAKFWLKMLEDNKDDKNILFNIVLRLNQVEFGISTIKKYANLDAVGIMVVNHIDSITADIRKALASFDIREIERSVLNGLEKHKTEFNYKY